MIYFISLFVLAFAVSLDSFGVGITYGMRKIKIPFKSIIIIALCSGIMILIAMGIGQGIVHLFSARFAEILGGAILVGIGIWALYNITRSNLNPIHVEKEESKVELQSTAEKEAEKQLMTFEIKKFGIVIKVLRTPMAADLDKSGVISGLEAFILGFALALDAFGAGLGAALMGYSPWLTAGVIATMSSLFVFLGMKFGSLFAQTNWISRISYLPGIILITFGVLKII